MTYLALPSDEATWCEVILTRDMSTKVKVRQGTRGVDGHCERGTASSHHEARGIVFATSVHDAWSLIWVLDESEDLKDLRGFSWRCTLSNIRNIRYPTLSNCENSMSVLCWEKCRMLWPNTLWTCPTCILQVRSTANLRSSCHGGHDAWCSFK